MKTIELLAPAKDLNVAKVAIDNGADAVYIGAPSFGARKLAANSLEDIAELIDYAHLYHCRVFVAFNTILYDNELEAAETLIWKLYELGIDALIIQDMGILRMKLPPLALHASTQTNNYDLEHIKFLDSLGFKRIILARELSLEQLREIRKEVKAELEVFIHGSLCVSLSGRCYISHYMFERSANRGECAQVCRMKWSVKDDADKILVKDKHILSLKDFNASEYLNELVALGIDSFKIEGRLKDENYVANVTKYYSDKLNAIKDVVRIGSGKCKAMFVADPERSFSRGESTYFLNGNLNNLVNQITPKSMGKLMGVVTKKDKNRLQIKSSEAFHNGDGLCYIDHGELKGVKVNNIDGVWVICNREPELKVGDSVYRNYDHKFVLDIERARTQRKIDIDIYVKVKNGLLTLECNDEDGIVASIKTDDVFELADKEIQRERVLQQLAKCGDTPFVCRRAKYYGDETLFIPVARANALRRELLDLLVAKRKESHKLLNAFVEDKTVICPTLPSCYLNATNEKAKMFYADHGLANVSSGFEKGGRESQMELMRSRYCLLKELGMCKKEGKAKDLKFPLSLYNDKHSFTLKFDCDACFMSVIN